MSAKKHILVPRNFTSADALRHMDSGKFQRMTGREANRLEAAGSIRQLGETGRVWQLTEESMTHSNRETGDGRVSLEIPGDVRKLLTAEMRRRPSWCVTV